MKYLVFTVFVLLERAPSYPLGSEFGKWRGFSDATWRGWGRGRDGRRMLTLCFRVSELWWPRWKIFIHYFQSGITPLIIAASAGKPNFVNLLLAKGANVNAQNNGGHSALQYAASKNHCEVALKLFRFRKCLKHIIYNQNISCEDCWNASCQKC